MGNISSVSQYLEMVLSNSSWCGKLPRKTRMWNGGLTETVPVKIDPQTAYVSAFLSQLDTVPFMLLLCQSGGLWSRTLDKALLCIWIQMISEMLSSFNKNRQKKLVLIRVTVKWLSFVKTVSLFKTSKFIKNTENNEDLENSVWEEKLIQF